MLAEPRRIVYVGIPSIDGRPYAALVDALMAEQALGFRQGIYFVVDWEIGCSFIPHARNALAKRFLAARNAPSIVFIDSDISWERGDLISLALRPEPVIGGTYRAKRDDERFYLAGPIEPVGALYKVGGLPSGFLKISRSAFAAVAAEPYGVEGSPAHNYRNYFPTGVRGGRLEGEDYGFCRLWREAGGTVWLDPSILLKHHDGMRAFTGDPGKWIKEHMLSFSHADCVLTYMQARRGLLRSPS